MQGEEGEGLLDGSGQASREIDNLYYSYTEVCKLVVHRRRQIGSGSLVLNSVRLSKSKVSSSQSTAICLLHWTTVNQPANFCSEAK